LDEGETRTGRVTSLADFGAFVNISGADGLVHLSEISWERISHPGEVLKVGQEVKVKVISIDKDKKRIGLSIRQLQADPWAKEVAQYQVGQLVEGKITRLTKFGAFARLEGEIEGLIHISEISEKRIDHPKEVLHEGDVVTLRVIKIDPDNHRIGLSLRRVESMAYADMDWQTLLETEEIPDLDEDQAETPAQEVEKTAAPDASTEKLEAPVQEVEQAATPAASTEKAEAPVQKAKQTKTPKIHTEKADVPVQEAEQEPVDVPVSQEEPVDDKESGSEEK